VSVCYISELSRVERGELVTGFIEDPKCYILIESWHIGSTGLNLQTQCNHNLEWDAPPSIGAMRQARGRVRRIRQPLAIEYQSTSIRVLVLDCRIQLLVFECII
jgi:SNF2 family DNA or RNA helicase